MNIWARILSELKIPLARIPFRDWPAMILLWLHLRRLTTALETLFTAWQSGTLPPPVQPAPPAVKSTPPRTRAQAAPRIRTRAPRVRPTVASTPVPHRVRADTPRATDVVMPRAHPGAPCTSIQKMRHSLQRRNCALFITLSK